MLHHARAAAHRQFRRWVPLSAHHRIMQQAAAVQPALSTLQQIQQSSTPGHYTQTCPNCMCAGTTSSSPARPTAAHGAGGQCSSAKLHCYRSMQEAVCHATMGTLQTAAAATIPGSQRAHKERQLSSHSRLPLLGVTYHAAATQPEASVQNTTSNGHKDSCPVLCHNNYLPAPAHTRHTAVAWHASSCCDRCTRQCCRRHCLPLALHTRMSCTAQCSPGRCLQLVVATRHNKHTPHTMHTAQAQLNCMRHVKSCRCSVNFPCQHNPVA